MNLLSTLVIFFVLSFNVYSLTIIAHRGLPRLYPEHSMQGLKEVLKLNIDYVEPDIVLSKDGIPFVLHDIHIDTTTNVALKYPKRKRKDGRYYAIDFNASELKTLVINHRINLITGKAAIATRNPISNSKHQIPKLAEFVNYVIDYNKKHSTNIGIYPEIKAPQFHLSQGSDITKIVHDRLLRFHKKNPNLKIIIQCFSSKTLKRLKSEKTPFFLVQLIGENSWGESTDDFQKMLTKNGIEEIAKYANGVGPWLKHLYNTKTKQGTDVILHAKKNNLKIHTYTLRNDALPKFVKTEQDVINFLKVNNIDGVFTDNAHTTVPLNK